MEWIVSRQMSVEAETAEEAVQKIDTGKTISLTVTVRPVKPIQPQNPLQMVRQAPSNG